MGKAEELAGAIVKMTKDAEIILDEKWKKNNNKTPQLLSLDKKSQRDTEAYL